MISPFIQMANFVGILFLYIQDVLPIEIFAPLFIISGFTLLAIVGIMFRKYQASTDYDLLFEKQTQQAKIFYRILENQKLVMQYNQMVLTDDFIQDLNYCKKISREKK